MWCAYNAMRPGGADGITGWGNAVTAERVCVRRETRCYREVWCAYNAMRPGGADGITGWSNAVTAPKILLATRNASYYAIYMPNIHATQLGAFAGSHAVFIDPMRYWGSVIVLGARQTTCGETLLSLESECGRDLGDCEPEALFFEEGSGAQQVGALNAFLSLLASEEREFIAAWGPG